MPPPIPIRMSAAGKCPRRLYYDAHRYEQSDPPDRQSLNRMALGDAAEILLIKNLLDDGWEVTDSNALPDSQQLELVTDDPIPMTGHPDGICRHPVHTQNRWVTLECKSMSSKQLAQVRQKGIAAVYPDYLAQAACYSRILYRQGKVAAPRRAVFAVMDRDGDNPSPERVAWDRDAETRIWQNLISAWENLRRPQPPERPYQPSDVQCQYCPYFTLCHDRKPPRRRAPLQKRAEPELRKAAQDWLEGNQKREIAAAILKQAAPDPYQAGITVGGVDASYFWPKDRSDYDPLLLEKHIPEDLLRQCRKPGTPAPRHWIRPSN